MKGGREEVGEREWWCGGGGRLSAWVDTVA